MPSALTEQPTTTVHVHEFTMEIDIAASIDLVFESILEQVGPKNQCPDGTELFLTLEPWPGGRWFRDMGNNTGILWGFVRSFLPSTLLELQGPMFASSATICHSMYRLSSE